MILFTWVYPKLGILKLVPQWGRYHHFQRLINELTSPEEREPRIDMIHRIVMLFVTSSLGGSALEMRIENLCWVVAVSVVECRMGMGKVLVRGIVGSWSDRALITVDQTVWYRLRVMVARISWSGSRRVSLSRIMFHNRCAVIIWTDRSK